MEVSTLKKVPKIVSELPQSKGKCANIFLSVEEMCF